MAFKNMFTPTRLWRKSRIKEKPRQTVQEEDSKEGLRYLASLSPEAPAGQALPLGGGGGGALPPPSVMTMTLSLCSEALLRGKSPTPPADLILSWRR